MIPAPSRSRLVKKDDCFLKKYLHFRLFYALPFLLYPSDMNIIAHTFSIAVYFLYSEDLGNDGRTDSSEGHVLYQRRGQA